MKSDSKFFSEYTPISLGSNYSSKIAVRSKNEEKLPGSKSACKPELSRNTGSMLETVIAHRSLILFDWLQGLQTWTLEQGLPECSADPNYLEDLLNKVLFLIGDGRLPLEAFDLDDYYPRKRFRDLVPEYIRLKSPEHICIVLYETGMKAFQYVLQLEKVVENSIDTEGQKPSSACTLDQALWIVMHLEFEQSLSEESPILINEQAAINRITFKTGAVPSPAGTRSNSRHDGNVGGQGAASGSEGEHCNQRRDQEQLNDSKMVGFVPAHPTRDNPDCTGFRFPS